MMGHASANQVSVEQDATSTHAMDVVNTEYAKRTYNDAHVTVDMVAFIVKCRTAQSTV